MNRSLIVKSAVALAVLLAGVATFSALVLTKSEPSATPSEHLGRLVRAFRATPVSHRIAVHAYGTSRAGMEWTATAEVAGRITQLADAFEEGEMVQAGELLATIDKLDFELAVGSAETEVASRQQELMELEQKKANIESVVNLRQQQLDYARAELDRSENLLRRGAGTQADYDEASSTYVERQTAVRDLENQLALIPIQEKSLSIAVDAANLRLQQAQRDLEQCEVRAPFTALCISRDAELHEEAAIGRRLGSFLGLERAEIVSLVEPRRAVTLFPNLGDSFGPIDLTSQTGSLVEEIRRRIEILGAPVDVTWRAGEGQAQWRGRLARVSAAVDEATRSVPLIIEVDDAFTAIRIGVRPALVPGMFVEVTIYGETLDDVFVVPRGVVRDGSVYVVRDERLVIQQVHVLALEEHCAVIDTGLNIGDFVVMADLFPAADGMRLRVVEVQNPITPRQGLPDLSSHRKATL